MSSSFPRISSELARVLPWEAILQLFDAKSVNQLEERLQLSRGTLSKAQRHYPNHRGASTPRGISARLHRILLTGISNTFTASGQMRSWMKKNWPNELLEQTESNLEAIYEKIDITQHLFRVGVFPVDYIERDEKAKILDLLLKNKQIQVIWLTGQGCTGKSTLALSLLHHNLESLRKKYEKYFWLDLEKCGYETGLLQIGEQINLEGVSVGVIEQRVKAITSKHRSLFILDGLQDIKRLEPWMGLIGYLGKVVVTSRFRLSSADLIGNRQIHQIQIYGFSQTQGRQFFRSDDLDINKIVALTGGLPLALRILSGMIQDAQIPKSKVVTYLTQNVLTTLTSPIDIGNPKTSVRACLELSCNALSLDYPNAAAYFKAAGVFRSRIILKDFLDKTVIGLTTKSHKYPIPPYNLLFEQHSQLLYRYNLLDFATISNKRFIKFTPLLHALVRDYISQEEDTLQVRVLRKEYRKIFMELLSDAKDVSNIAQDRYLFLIKMHLHDIINIIESQRSGCSIPDYQTLRNEWVNLITNVFRPALGESVVAAQLDSTLQSRWHIAFDLLLMNIKGEKAFEDDLRKAKICFSQVLKTGDNFLQALDGEHYQMKVLSEKSSYFFETWHEFFWRQIASAAIDLARCNIEEYRWDVARKVLDQYSFAFSHCNDILLAALNLHIARIMNIRGETRETIALLSQSIELSLRYLRESQYEATSGIERIVHKKIGETEQLSNKYYDQSFQVVKFPDDNEIQDKREQLDFIEFLLENRRVILAERLMRSLHRRLLHWDDLLFFEKMKRLPIEREIFCH